MSDTSPQPSSDIRLVVVTPETTVIDTSARFVALPLYDGEIGIARNHSPLIGRLGYGEMRIVALEEPSLRYYVDGGFVQVVDNLVSVLTNRAIPAVDVDAEVAREQLSRALKRPAAGDEEIAVRDRLTTQARAQLRIAGRGQ